MHDRIIQLLPPLVVVSEVPCHGHWAVCAPWTICFTITFTLLIVQRIVKESALPFFFDPDAGSRIGLLPRYATDEAGIMWFQLPSQMIFHTANAWQVPTFKL